MSKRPRGFSDYSIEQIRIYIHALQNGWQTQDANPLEIILVQAENIKYILDKKLDAIQRVQDLHKPFQMGTNWIVCDVCRLNDYAYADWPCDTILALNNDTVQHTDYCRDATCGGCEELDGEQK